MLTVKVMIHTYFKYFIGCIALFFHLSLFSQSIQVKDSVKAALDLSTKYSEIAVWYQSMDHYNADSMLYYTDKAIALLDNKEQLHQTALKSLQQLKKRNVDQGLSSDQVTALSRAYQKKALYFREMPHFNRDSTVFYLDMAALLLQSSKPLQYRLLAELYLDITDRANRSHNFNVVDSLAPIGWDT